jgi:AraC-like DNA-binding protein
MATVTDYQRDLLYRSAYGQAADIFERVRGLCMTQVELDRRLAEARAMLCEGVSSGDVLAAIDDAYRGRRPRF